MTQHRAEQEFGKMSNFWMERRRKKEPPTGTHRTEHDSMGDVQVPAKAYYGAQTQRAVNNFPVSGATLSPDFIHALGLVKWAAAVVNEQLGKLARSGKPATVVTAAIARELAGFIWAIARQIPVPAA